ncbi:MAG: amidohydrolase [Bacteroidota bacterium]
MEQLTVSAVQAFLHWESPDINFEQLGKQLNNTITSTDLIVLPEMFTTGFSMNAAPVAETINGPAMQWMQAQAQRFEAVVTGSLIIEEGGRFFNRLIWMRPDGSFEQYDKRHLFTLAKEHETYTAGTERLIVDLKGWKVCPLICYDLRFPVWSRNSEAYDVLIYVANWPITRSHHWKTLLMARAIENQCYILGVNRVGEDEKGYVYSGDTCLIDYSGRLLYQVSDSPQVITTTIEKEPLRQFRQKLNFLPDQDSFTILP